MAYNEFISSFDDVLRSNRFSITCKKLGDNVSLRAKATMMPGATIGVCEAFFGGRSIKLAGDYTPEEWTVTLYFDNKAETYLKVVDWVNDSIMEFDEANVASTDHREYKADIDIEMLDRQGELAIYGELFGAFPTSISSVDLDMSSNDTPAEVTITFVYDWLRIQ
jgi:hypothetical protein